MLQRLEKVACFVVLSFSLFCHSSVTCGQTITHFTADINSGAVISQGVVGTGSTASGVGQFVLTQPDGNPNGTTLSYFIQLSGIDLDGAQTPSPLDNVTAVHLHNVTECSPVSPQCLPGDTALTKHVLNIFGAPRLDDDDLVVDPVAGTLSGLWDVSDTDLTFPPTLSIADPAVLNLLFNGDIYFLLHTNEYPGGAIGGQLRVVPEPSQLVPCLIGLLGAVGVFRRKS